METAEQATLYEQRIDFLNFLRGMETKEGPAHPASSAGFLNFLRGMETAVRG